MNDEERAELDALLRLAIRTDEEQARMEYLDGKKLQIESIVAKAGAALRKTDYKITRATERGDRPGPAWRAWRDECRDMIGNPVLGWRVPPEPEFGSDVICDDAPIDPNQLMSARGSVGDAAAEDALTANDLLAAMQDDAEVVQDVVSKLSRAKRKKFTELLNVELAELQQERGGPREDRVRESDIEALLGLFARAGEM